MFAFGLRMLIQCVGLCNLIAIQFMQKKKVVKWSKSNDDLMEFCPTIERG